MYTMNANSFDGKSRALFNDDNLGIEDIPEELKNAFDIDHDFSSCCSAYHPTLRSSAPLLTVKPLSTSPAHLMVVVHRFRRKFYELLQYRNLRAVLLLTYRLGLMRKIDLW